jgi:hypothetical protein
MLRPGRLDAIVSFSKPDADAAQRLLRKYTSGMCAPDVDYAAVAARCAGMIPAVIAEVGARAKLAAIARDPTAPRTVVTTADLLTAAEQLQAHQALVEAPAEAGPSAGDVGKQLRKLLFASDSSGPTVNMECGKCQHVAHVALSPQMRCENCGWFSTTGLA